MKTCCRIVCAGSRPTRGWESWCFIAVALDGESGDFSPPSMVCLGYTSQHLCDKHWSHCVFCTFLRKWKRERLKNAHKGCSWMSAWCWTMHWMCVYVVHAPTIVGLQCGMLACGLLFIESVIWTKVYVSFFSKSKCCIFPSQCHMPSDQDSNWCIYKVWLYRPILSVSTRTFQKLCILDKRGE